MDFHGHSTGVITVVSLLWSSHLTQLLLSLGRDLTSVQTRLSPESPNGQMSTESNKMHQQGLLGREWLHQVPMWYN
jgi:hypothetical protein